MNLWAAKWRSYNLRDGRKEHIIYENLLPVLFRTRLECREYIKKRYGYIADREDLQEEPHGWMMPKPIKVAVEAKDVRTD